MWTVRPLPQHGPGGIDPGDEDSHGIGCGLVVHGRRGDDGSPLLRNEVYVLIGISNPFEPAQDYATLHLDGGGVATSGKDRRRWMLGDILSHHIIDPRTGQPAVTDILTATVIAPTVMEAEAAAKTVLLLGSEVGLEWLESDSGLVGLLVLDNGQILTSRRAEKYL